MFTLIISGIAVLLIIGIAIRYFNVDRPANKANQVKAKTIAQKEESRIQKLWGMARLALLAILMGFLGDKAGAESINGFVDNIGLLISSVEGVVGLVGVVIATVGDWSAKEKA